MQRKYGPCHKRNKINVGEKGGGDFYAPIRRVISSLRRGVILLGAVVVLLPRRQASPRRVMTASGACQSSLTRAIA